MIRRAFGISVVIAASMLVSCDDTVTPAGSENVLPGWLDVRLTASPEGPEALLFQVIGGSVDSVSSLEHVVFSNQQAPDLWRVMFVGELANEVVARIWVPNPSAVGQYQVVLEQAVAGQGFGQRSASGYSLRVEAPGGL